MIHNYEDTAVTVYEQQEDPRTVVRAHYGLSNNVDAIPETESDDAASNTENDLEDGSVAPPLTFLQRLWRLRVILILMLGIGFIAGTPSSIIPQLQQDTFGNSSFIITGGLSAGHGALGCVVVPLYGSFSDAAGRKNALLIVQALSVLPFTIFLLSDSFWAYSIANVFLTFHDGTMSLLLASVADIVPISTGAHANSFAIAVAMFFLGVGTSPFLGAFLTTKQTFMICGSATIGTILITALFFRDPRDTQVGESGGLLTGNRRQRSPMDPHQPHKLTNKSHLARLFEAFTSVRDLRVIALVVFVNGLTENLLDNLLLLYLDNTLNFTPTQQSIVITIVSVGSVFGLIAVTALLRRHLGSLGTLRVELFSNVIICALYSFLTSAWGIYVTTAGSILGMGVFPAACAVAALCLEEEAAGLAQGVASSARMLSGGIGPLFFGWLFEATQETVYPGASFLVAAGFVLVAFVFTRFLHPRFTGNKL